VKRCYPFPSQQLVVCCGECRVCSVYTNSVCSAYRSTDPVSLCIQVVLCRIDLQLVQNITSLAEMEYNLEESWLCGCRQRIIDLLRIYYYYRPLVKDGVCFVIVCNGIDAGINQLVLCSICVSAIPVYNRSCGISHGGAKLPLSLLREPSLSCYQKK
jgi:hypothetical protein